MLFRMFSWGILLAVLLNIPLSAEWIELCQNGSYQIKLPKQAKEAGIVNPEIANLHMSTPSQITLYGLKPGITSCYASDENGRKILHHDIKVSLDLRPLRQELLKISPQITIDAMHQSIRVKGEVASPLEVTEIMDIVKAYAGDAPILNHLRVNQSQQVNLRVRVAEIARNLDKELGIKWRSLFRPEQLVMGLTTRFGSSLQEKGTFQFGFVDQKNDLNVFIDALASDGLVTILAEPDLTTLSGQTASFLAGGEFPVPIASQRDQIDVTFKEFGVRLSFTPIVQEGKRIKLTVAPEVSEISEANSIVIKGLRIPGLKTRKAETTLELMSGQSFAIAGLLQQNSSSGISAFPPLDQMPIIGPLFRSSRFKKHESELVIIITPYLVQPVTATQKVRTPVEGFLPASDFDREIKGKLLKNKNVDESFLSKIGFMY